MHANAMPEWNKKVDYRKLWRASSAPTKAQVPLTIMAITPPPLCLTLPRTSSFVFDNPRWQPHNAPPEIQSGFESLNSLSRIKNVSSGPSKCVKQHKTAVSCSKGSIWGGVGVGSARIGFMF